MRKKYFYMSVLKKIKDFWKKSDNFAEWVVRLMCEIYEESGDDFLKIKNRYLPFQIGI
jgi:hypothetical protein